MARVSVDCVLCWLKYGGLVGAFAVCAYSLGMFGCLDTLRKWDAQASGQASEAKTMYSLLLVSNALSCFVYAVLYIVAVLAPRKLWAHLIGFMRFSLGRSLLWFLMALQVFIGSYILRSLGESVGGDDDGPGDGWVAGGVLGYVLGAFAMLLCVLYLVKMCSGRKEDEDEGETSGSKAASGAATAPPSSKSYRDPVTSSGGSLGASFGGKNDNPFARASAADVTAVL